jgi:8-amino-7-oxononanoate synthase
MRYHSDMSFDWITNELQALDAAGLRRRPRVCEPLPHGRCRVDGAELVHFASNDYLGLAGHPRVIAAALDATSRYGTGGRASALVSGRTPLHAELEQAIADFEGTEAAVLFPTGFAANVGAIGSLVESGDVVFSDRLNHASLIDGCRLSKAKLRVYSHDELGQLADELAKCRDARRRLIVTDSLFSMDGDAAPLVELVELAERTGSMLLVDEAHATGVYGPHGRGWCEEVGVSDSFCVRVGTLSKAIGSQGGFVAGSQLLCDWVRNKARTQMFSTSLTPGACGAALESLRRINAEPDRREHVRSLSRLLRAELVATGWSAIGEPDCPIVPLIVGEPNTAVQLSALLQERGFLVPAIRPPTVPRGTSRLRVSLTADHTPEDIHLFIEVLGQARSVCGGLTDSSRL